MLFKRYSYGPEKWKREELAEIVGKVGVDFLQTGIDGFPPDLLLYREDSLRFWFAEVKGPNDRLHERQQRDFCRIRKRFQCKVELVPVRFL